MSPISTTTKKINYLNNRDLLAEIHKSKCSYSSFIKTEYAQHDIIVPSLDQITAEIINEAKKNKAKRLALERLTAAKNSGDKKIKLIDCQIDVNTIQETDVVIRVMTFDHIPLAPGRKKTIKRIADSYVKINFPPFQHWKFSENNELICVGKSHWKGPVDTGCFEQAHGKITENLGRMFIKLTERYAQKSNWRGYTYNEEMRGQAIVQLSQIGLQFDELKSENPFAYYTAAITNSFTRVLNVEKQNQDIRDDLLESAGLTPSSTRQNSQAYAGEISRQAELYKKLRMPKTQEIDETFIAESNEIFEEIIKDGLTDDTGDESANLQSTP
jgi:hypothetical protein